MAARKKKAGASAPPPSGDDVEAFLARLEHPAKAEILALRAIIRGVDRSIGEGIKWNAPSFHLSEHFATFHLRHEPGVQLILHLGVKPQRSSRLRHEIADPDSLLTWRSPDRATVTLRDLADIAAKKKAFAKLIRQWIAFVR